MLDRLFANAKGDYLNEEQLRALKSESVINEALTSDLNIESFDEKVIEVFKN